MQSCENNATHFNTIYTIVVLNYITRTLTTQSHKASYQQNYTLLWWKNDRDLSKSINIAVQKYSITSTGPEFII